MSETVTKPDTDMPAPCIVLPGNPLRRAVLAGTAALATLSGGAFPPPPPPVNSDAGLIRVCNRFAETELKNWYWYVLAPGDLADEQDPPPDLDALHWIEATSATTPEGWCAKAPALAAWHRDVFDDPEDGRDGHTTLLASLVRDMVAPTRPSSLRA